jgi:hypothetical protein
MQQHERLHTSRVSSPGAPKLGLVGTNVFLGHGRSQLWREVEDFIEDRLHLPVDELDSSPVAGMTTTARLSELLDATFLIIPGEDDWQMEHCGRVKCGPRDRPVSGAPGL